MKTKIKRITWTGKRIRDAALLLAVGVMALCCRDGNLEWITGTKWKLTAIGDVQTGVLEEIVPRKGVLAEINGELMLMDGDTMDCEKCYTLTFVTNNEALGWSVSNTLQVNFFEPIRISATNISFANKPLSGGTKIGEHPQPTRYCKALSDLTSYICYNNELKLFYNNNRNYLLYKMIQQ